MTDNLETALRRAVGLELTDANGDPEEPLPGTPALTAAEPPALNSDQLLTKLTAALGITNEGN
ncbi:hypothetical protein [Pseudarthrobacter oxydans]|uniref:hypothetical protein n=1 Tax=Pseudarthrobacter oxydans TaxID=1671 RepID=UPI002AA8F5A7|nr:hypothetical protein [Pseudarthrobacter oxydans]WPU08082.1 hypothetical protein SMD14_13000 [Pseudarthrobacter oxydans]